MNILKIRNVHRALPLALEILNHAGERRDSRNGPVRVASGPVTTLYDNPTEKVLFWPERDANPFFHFFESIWMLGGKNDVDSVARFAKQVNQYTDDGIVFHGVYGYRWRVGMPYDAVRERAFGIPIGTRDQLTIIADRLRKNPEDRRSVLQMWDAENDLDNPSKDVPCNVTATFQVDGEGKLNLVVFNRSNDIVWGCYGANAVQFGTLLEYVAFRAGYKPGTYHQISVNWHGYEATYLPLYEKMVDPGGTDLGQKIQQICPYEAGEVKPYPLMSEGTDPVMWDRDLQQLLKTRGRAPVVGTFTSDPFFQDVAIPIMRAHDAYKDTEGEDRYKRSLEALAGCHATDWFKACSEWINRRWKKFQKDADDGPTP